LHEESLINSLAKQTECISWQAFSLKSEHPETVITTYSEPLWRKTYSKIANLNVKISEIITIILMDYVLRLNRKNSLIHEL
jgi:hypothetical protein